MDLVSVLRLQTLFKSKSAGKKQFKAIFSANKYLTEVVEGRCKFTSAQLHSFKLSFLSILPPTANVLFRKPHIDLGDYRCMNIQILCMEAPQHTLPVLTVCSGTEILLLVGFDGKKKESGVSDVSLLHASMLKEQTERTGSVLSKDTEG